MVHGPLLFAFTDSWFGKT